MSSVLIVLPILSLLMFDLGLTLRRADFVLVAKRPRAVIAGIIGQVVILPVIVWLLMLLLDLPHAIFVGMMLIACCPGGSSSNVFTGIARGDVALSVSLTALTSIITLFTLPLLMGAVVELPVANLVMQNLVLVLLPIILGMLLLMYKPHAAAKIHKVVSRLAFPLLMLLAAVFFLANREEIIANFPILGPVVTMMVILAMGAGSLMAWIAGLNRREHKTLVIEVGMQNAAQAIALASSPLVFNDKSMAIPAIVYALMMNVVLLIYVAMAKRWRN